jgi:hypothetical protein
MIVVTKGYIEVADEMVKDLFITAFEGGSSYWAEVNQETPAGEGAVSERFWAWFEKGGSMGICSSEDATEELGEVNMTSIARALQIMHDEWPEQFEALVDESFDAETADIFLQLACMGEVEFG